MFRAKLLKVIALGLCMSILYTGAAYAQSTEGASPAFEGTMVADEALFEKQKEIDQILFVDQSKDIEAKGAPDAVPADGSDVPVSDKGELYKDMPVNATDADGRVYKGSDVPAATDDVTVTDDAATDPENPDVIFYTTAGGVAEPGQEAELVYATGENADVVTTGAEADKDGMPTPLIVLLIAGGALVIGGGAVALGKKRK